MTVAEGGTILWAVPYMEAVLSICISAGFFFYTLLLLHYFFSEHWGHRRSSLWIESSGSSCVIYVVCVEDPIAVGRTGWSQLGNTHDDVDESATGTEMVKGV